jgi:hypothetical protein
MGNILDDLVEILNRDVLSPHDWGRLYDLVIYVHRNHPVLTDSDVRKHLLLNSLSAQRAYWFSVEFFRFSQLLDRYDGRASDVRTLSE